MDTGSIGGARLGIFCICKKIINCCLKPLLFMYYRFVTIAMFFYQTIFVFQTKPFLRRNMNMYTTIIYDYTFSRWQGNSIRKFSYEDSTYFSGTL